jgi:insulysin
MDIIKPKFDNRKIIGGTLNNKIKYIVVKDKLINKTVISVSINAGSFNNPKKYDGLAHFLEHMLFMGSKKYPNENYYFETLNKHGGYSNAYTDHFNTVYYFNVFNDYIFDIVDIFVQFFISPLFSEKSINKEMNAVNNEHLKNIHNEARKLYQFCLDITNKMSPLNTFATGSLETLNHNDIRDKMIEFYKNYYTTDNMSICIVSSLPQKNINKILNIFDLIPISKKKEFKLLIEKPINDYFYTENMGKQYYLEALQEIYNVIYLWEIPLNNYFNNPLQIFCLLITDSSEKSVYFHLKNNGYITSLTVEQKNEGIFIIQINLTKYGYNHIDYIESLLFDTINNILTMDIKNIALYYQKINNINFNYSPKSDVDDLSNYLATNHHYNKTKHAYSDNNLIYNILDTDKYIEYFKYIDTNKFIKIIQSNIVPKNLQNSNISNYNITTYYNTKYADITNERKVIKYDNTKYNNINTNNPFLDINTHIYDSYNHNIPIKLQSNVWYGSTNFEPNVFLNLKINSNKFYNTPKQYNITIVSTIILNYIIETILNNILSLPFSIYFDTAENISSIILNIKSINSTKHILLLIKAINIINYNDFIDKYLLKYFDNLLIELKSKYENIIFSNSWEYSEYIFDTSISNQSYKIEELINNLDINILDIKNFIKNLLKFENRNILHIYGNINKNDAIKISNTFILNYKEIKYIPDTIKLEKNIIVNHPNKLETANSVTYMYHISNKFEPVLNILMMLYCLIFNELFFNELRTKKQLGYLVKLGSLYKLNNYYIIQKIQSDKSVDIIDNEINNFNKNIIPSYINKISFSDYINTLRTNLEQQYDSLSLLYNKYNSEIVNETFIFNKNEILLKTLKKIKLQHLIKFIELINKPIKIIVKGNV